MYILNDFILISNFINMTCVIVVCTNKLILKMKLINLSCYFFLLYFIFLLGQIYIPIFLSFFHFNVIQLIIFYNINILKSRTVDIKAIFFSRCQLFFELNYKLYSFIFLPILIIFINTYNNSIIIIIQIKTKQN